MTRARLAPSDKRTAISRLRLRLLARYKLPTFAQVNSKTSTTPAPMRASAIPTTSRPFPFFACLHRARCSRASPKAPAGRPTADTVRSGDRALHALATPLQPFRMPAGERHAARSCRPPCSVAPDRCDPHTLRGRHIDDDVERSLAKPVEAAGVTPYDRRRNASQPHRASHDLRIGREVTSPNAIGNQRSRFGRARHTSEARASLQRNPERLNEVVAYEHRGRVRAARAGVGSDPEVVDGHRHVVGAFRRGRGCTGKNRE